MAHFAASALSRKKREREKEIVRMRFAYYYVRANLRRRGSIAEIAPEKASSSYVGL